MRNTTAKRKLRKATAAERRRLGLAKDATIETVDLHDPNLAPEHRDHFITGIKTEVARLDELIAYWYRHRDQCRIEGCDHGRAELSDQVSNLLSPLPAVKDLFGVIITADPRHFGRYVKEFGPDAYAMLTATERAQ